MKGEFYGFEGQVEATQALQDLCNVVALFGYSPGVDKDIINIDEDEPMKILPENLMHEILEYGGGVYQSYGMMRYS